MHELSVAERLVDRAIEAAADAGVDAARIDELTVELGAATHLTPDQLGFCIEAVAADTPAGGADVVFERIPARGECRCGWTGDLEPLANAVGGVPDRRCPDCGRGVSLTAGRECRLAGVDVAETAAATAEGPRE